MSIPTDEREPWGIYVRISYARRRRADGTTVLDTLGVERQEPPCRELVDRHGGYVAKVFIDNDRSAFKGTRRDFEQALEWTRSGRIVGLAAWDADRLTRDPDRDNGRIIELAERYGRKLATVTGDYDLATSSGRMMFRIAGALARRESEHRSERMLLKFDELAEAGLPKGTGKRALGYERDGMTVVEAEAELLREAARRLLQREPDPMTTIIEDFAGRGVTAVMGGRLSTTSLRRALVAPRTAGLRQHRGQVVGQAKWPAILEPNQRERLLVLFARPDRRKQGRPRTYVYSGFLRCGRPECGQVMVGCSTGSGRPMYGCRGGRADPDHKGCGRTWISKEPFEREMLDQLVDALRGPDLAAAAGRRLQAVADGQLSVDRLDADRLEVAELATVLDTRFATAEHRRRHQELEARIRHVETTLETLPDLELLVGLPRLEEDLRALWERWRIPERRRLLAATLEYVRILPKGRGRRWDPDRIKPQWK